MIRLKSLLFALVLLGIVALPIVTQPSRGGIGGFFGVSGYFSSVGSIQSALNAVDSSGVGIFRVSFNPEWFSTKPQPYSKDLIQFLLDHSDVSVIVDRNHLYPTGRVSDEEAVAHWAMVEDGVFQVLQDFPNNSRVMVEFVNEYTGDDFYSRMQGLVDDVRSAGYSNGLVFNRMWTNQWSFVDDSLDNVFQGFHYYFNSLSGSSAIENLRKGLALGLKIINTEVGADDREGGSFTVGKVDELNSFLAQSAELGVVNCVWMNWDMANWRVYEKFGFKFPSINVEEEVNVFPSTPPLSPRVGVYVPAAPASPEKPPSVSYPSQTPLPVPLPDEPFESEVCESPVDSPLDAYYAVISLGVIACVCVPVLLFRKLKK